MINGMDEVAVTNLDGLDSLPSIKVCTHYKLRGETIAVPPSDVRLLAQCEPVYVEMPGWQMPTHDAKRFTELPRNAQSYLHKLAELSHARLRIASVGPNRDQTIVL
jgi:adenylosuccinate synthase